ncbi:MAG: DUF4424 domain-containing protein [bacterium]|nr:DUF4424 domain-containing protein [bacterium]
MKRVIRIVALLFLNFYYAGSINANPMPIGGPGKTPLPYGKKNYHKGVSLIKEKVVIHDDAHTLMPSFIPNGPPMKLSATKYEGTYFLKNTGNKKVSITIGFPVVSGGYNAGGGKGYIEKFSVSAGDKRLKVSGKSHDRIDEKAAYEEPPYREYLRVLKKYGFARDIPGNPEYIKLISLGKNRKELKRKIYGMRGLNTKQKKELYLYLRKELFGKRREFGDFHFFGELDWYIFKVNFKPRETVTLKISYLSSHGNIPDRYAMDYILQTGASWKGKIGECKIIVRFKNPIEHYDIKTGNFEKVNSREIMFLYQDFLPKEDISILYIHPNMRKYMRESED